MNHGGVVEPSPLIQGEKWLLCLNTLFPLMRKDNYSDNRIVLKKVPEPD